MMIRVFYQVFDIAITCFEMFLLYYLLKDYKKDTCNKIHVLLFCLFYLFSGVIMTALKVPTGVKTSVLLLMFTFLGQIIFDLKVQSLLFYGILYLIIILSGEQIIIQSCKLLHINISKLIAGNKAYSIEIIVLSKMITFFLVATIKRLMTPNKGTVTFKQISPYIVSNITMFGILIFLGLTNLDSPSSKYAAALPIISLLILLSCIYNVIASSSYMDILIKEQEEKATSYELKLKADYYQKKLSDEERIRSIYHDMKNHILLLKEEYSTENATQSILDDLDERIEKYGKYIETGNEFLNIIINDKVRIASKQNIRVHTKINFKQGGFINPLDISTIFGNAIDNAIEACELVEKEKRFIELKADKRNGFLIIVFENSCQWNKTFKHELPTSKQDKFHHGLGIKSITNTVNKYNGECKFRNKDGMFILKIVIPVQ